MKLIRSCLFAAACLAVFSVASSSAQQSFEERAEALIDRYANDGQFSGVVAVASNGTPVFVKSVGMANTDWEIPNGPETKFRLGSLTKQFTAVCILQLEEQGKLSVSDPLSRFISGVPEAWNGVTLHQLLSHTSGIPNYTAYATYDQTKKPTQWDVLNTVRSVPMRFAPGTSFEYSNTNFFLLGMVVERVSRLSYDEYLRRNVFARAGMEQTGYDFQSRTVLGRATGYLGDSRRPQAASYLEMEWPFAAGALYSTLGDLITWNEALESGKLISPASLKKMRTPVRNNYGYGIFINSNPYSLLHTGGIDGFATVLIYLPEDRVTFVVLSNFETAKIGDIVSGVMDLYRGTGNPNPVFRLDISVDETVLSRYAGRYQNAQATNILTVTLEEGLLYGRFSRGSKYVMFAAAESEFFVKFSTDTWKFNVENDLAISVLYKPTPTATGSTWRRLPDE